MIHKRLLLFALFFVTYSSCKIACENNVAGVIFDGYNNNVTTGFDSADLSIIKVTTYKRGSNFSEEIKRYITGTSIDSGNGIDTLPFNGFIRLSVDEDKIIELPHLSRTYKVRDLDWVATKKNKDIFGFGEVDPCTNGVTLFINDSLYQEPAYMWDRQGQTFIIWK